MLYSIIMKANPASRWAKWVSDVISPPVVTGFLAVALALHDSETWLQALAASFFYLGIAVITPMIFLVWMVRRGSITDIHMPLRRERYWPLLVMVTCIVITWFGVRAASSWYAMRFFTSFMLIETVLGLLITLYWQISIHAAMTTGVTVIAGLVFGSSAAIVLSPLIPLVIAARLRLARHTPAQVIGGMIAGGLVPYIIMAWLGIKPL